MEGKRGMTLMVYVFLPYILKINIAVYVFEVEFVIFSTGTFKPTMSYG